MVYSRSIPTLTVLLELKKTEDKLKKTEDKLKTHWKWLYRDMRALKLQISWITVEVVSYPFEANFMMLTWTPVVSESQIGLASHFHSPPTEQVWIGQCTAGWCRRVDAHVRHTHSWYQTSPVKSQHYWIGIPYVGRCSNCKSKIMGFDRRPFAW